MSDKQHAKSVLPIVMATVFAVSVVWILPFLPEIIRYSLTVLAILAGGYKFYQQS